HRGGDRPLGGGELGGVQVVHGVPEPAVVGYRDGDLREPGAGGGGPPLLEAQLAARGDNPVHRGQGKVCPDRREPHTSSIAPATPNRSKIPQTAARSPNALCWVRSGLPGAAPDRRSIT